MILIPPISPLRHPWMTDAEWDAVNKKHIKDWDDWCRAVRIVELINYWCFGIFVVIVAVLSALKIAMSP